MNPAARKLYAWTESVTEPLAADTSDLSLEVCLPDGRRLEFQSWPLPRALRECELHHLDLLLRVPASAKHPSGRHWAATFTAIPLAHASASPAEVVLTLQDSAHSHDVAARLLESERELREAQRLSHVGSWSLDFRTGVMSWTDELYRLGGLDPTQPAPSFEEHKKLYTPESWLKVKIAAEQALLDAKPYQLELEAFRNGGEPCWVMTRGEPYFDETGQVVGQHGTVQDITDWKRLVEKLENSETRFRALVDRAPLPIALLAGEEWYLNAAFTRAFGYTTRDIPNLAAWWSAADPDHTFRERLESSWERAAVHSTAGARVVPPQECHVHCKNGEIRIVEIGAVGVPNGFLVTLFDLTARKQAEARLLREQTVLLEAEKLSGLGAWEWDTSTNEFTVSEGWMRIHGATSRTMTLDAVNALVHPDDLPALAAAGNAAQSAAAPLESEHRILRQSDGAIRIVQVRGAPVRTGDGLPVKLFGVARDITDQRGMELDRANLAERLQLSQKLESVGRLAGGIAHDFNNILTVINGYSQLLLARLGPTDPSRDTLSEIYKAGERAAGLTGQLLAFSRKQVLQPRVLDLNQIVRGMVPMLKRLVGEDIEVEVAAGPDTCAVNADPHQFEQVILNLAVNAREAMPGGGKLRIETSAVHLDSHYTSLHPDAREGSYLLLSFSDTGKGIDEQTRRRIFEPFFTTKPLGEGNGLGLATVQGIVAQSGGHINVRSQPGHGARFEIYLPAVEDQAAEAEQPAAPAGGGAETILVVEDMPEVLEFTAMALSSYGYRVLKASSPADAVRLCASEPVHLLLTDIVMPQVSGRELARRLSQAQPSLKVLFMSGYTDNLIVRDGVLDPGIHFIEKPFSPEALAHKIRSVLGPPLAPSSRILVVEDEAGVRSFFCAALQQAGYTVTEAANGKRALEMLRAAPVDLVITDLVMPEVEGLEIIQILRKQFPALRVIAVSGAFGGQFLKPARLLGATAVLPKPVSAEVLLHTVAEVLQRPR